MKKNKIHEGKTKKIYQAENDHELIQEFKDDVITPKGGKKATVKGKGSINKQMSAYLFKVLDSYNIPTHFIKELSDKEMLIKKLNMVPIIVMVRNIADGSLVERFGVEAGKNLECPIIEYYLKDEERDDPMINENHIISFGHANADEIREMHRTASKANAILKAFFIRRRLKLIDLRFEFGRHHGRIVLADEISTDTCQFQDMETNQKMETGGSTRYLDKYTQNIEEIKNRLFIY